MPPRCLKPHHGRVRREKRQFNWVQRNDEIIVPAEVESSVFRRLEGVTHRGGKIILTLMRWPNRRSLYVQGDVVLTRTWI